MTSRLRPLDVSVSGMFVGQLVMNRAGLVRWLPSPEWETRGQSPRLGVAFLRKPGPREAGTGLPAWFENLLPEEGSALRGRLAIAHGLREGNRFGLLETIGLDLPGAVQIAPSDAPPPPSKQEAPLAPKGSESALEKELSARNVDVKSPHLAPREPTQAEAPDASDVSPDLFRFALAGMMPKLSMSMANDRLVLRAHGPQGQWIVKLPSHNYPELPEVEYATMAWAAAAGFDVPTHMTVNTELLEGVPASWSRDLPKAFAIRRFDRRDDGSKVHQEDLCQALEWLPAHKHGQAGARRISLDGALRLVRDVAGEEAGREMSRRIGFVIASGNDDAHLKNWSLLWGNSERPTLTPCYDFVSTIAWEERFGWGLRGGPTLSLGLGRTQRFALLNEGALKLHAEKADCPWAIEETKAGILRGRDAWAAASGTAPEFMRTAIAKHWENVPLLRSFSLPHT